MIVFDLRILKIHHEILYTCPPRKYDVYVSLSLLLAVKRLMREAIELKDPTPMYSAQPLEENLFEWHFTILGPHGTDYEGGRYHGRILLPSEYPMKPPSIILLTVSVLY